MAFDFPNSPSNGQQFTPPGGPTYVFTAGVWKLVGGIGAPGNLSISDAPPPSPSPGQMWLESDTGNLFAYWADADSSQWVQINVPNVSGLSTSQAKNRIVNGAMQISQENGRTSISSGFPADQWAYIASGATATTASQDGNPNFIRLLVQTIIASPAAGNIAYFSQAVEGKKVADFSWGATGAKQAVLRFKARSTAAPFTFSAAVRNYAGTRSYVRNFTITVANQWQEFTAIIPGDTTGTWPTDNTGSVVVSFCPMSGSTYITAPGAWTAGNFFAGTGIGNLFSAVQSFDFADVGLYLDADNSGIPPRWEMPDEASELIACQRYYQNVYGVLDVTGNTGVTLATHVNFKPVMRIAPTTSFTATTFATSNITGLGTAGGVTPISSYLTGTITTTGRAYCYGNITANARM